MTEFSLILLPFAEASSSGLPCPRTLGFGTLGIFGMIALITALAPAIRAKVIENGSAPFGSMNNWTVSPGANVAVAQSHGATCAPLIEALIGGTSRGS
ncbi:hypothetical protein D9M71_372370 [compost metagenome]